MSKPAFWRVWINRDYFDFGCRYKARRFAAMQRCAGCSPRIEAFGG